MIHSVLVIPATAISLLVAFLYFKRNEKNKTRNKLPPGNTSCMPLIGATLAFFRPQPLTTLGGFMQHHMSRHGKVFLSKLMSGPTVVSADANLNQFVLKNELKVFETCWPSTFRKLFGTTDEASRKLVRSSMFDFLSGKNLRTLFLEDVDQHAAHLLGSWKEGSVVYAKLEASKFFLYLAVKRNLGMTREDSEIEKLSREYNSFIKGVISFPLYIPRTAYWKAFQARENILNFFEAEVEKRMAKMGDMSTAGQDSNDFLGCLLNTKYNLTKETIGDLLLGVLFAGHDNISRAMTLLIYFLHGCPAAIEQLREEHLLVVRLKGGDAKLTWDDYRTMKFTKCVINETLRLGSISRFTQRKATADVEINDYILPRGFNVLLHFQAVHMDPALYEEPEQFNPWRWLSSAGTNISKNFMAFGGGEHYCPGAELAKLDMAIFLHHFMLKCEWELAEVDCPFRTPFVEFPKGLPIKIRGITPQVKI